MKTLSIITAWVVVAVFFSTQVLAQDTSGSIVRPLLVDAKVGGTQIAKPDDYRVTVGDLLELEYSYPVIPAAMPEKLNSTSSNEDVIAADPPKTVVVPGLTGAGKKAFCFQAKKAGISNVVITIDGNDYRYTITVDRAEGESSKPELCKAVYTAIQFKGKVYIFGNGIHPTAGYRTYFEKAKIAIWPPQFGMMCKKPAGVVAQVLTPFSVQASFNADTPVESVIITDSDGKHTIKVVQLK